MINTCSYVLITPACNEEAHIEKLITSVISQTFRPLKWVIVSDGSIDRTDEIVARYAAAHPFMLFRRRIPDGCRDFRSKVRAIDMGYNLIKDLDFAFIGNLDADVSFGASYYESIISRLLLNDRLGIAGGICLDAEGEPANRHLLDSEEVRGAIQLFRRACYEEIGGYLPLPLGGEDTVAQGMARMLGWEVRSFPDQEAIHHRPTGTAIQAAYRARFMDGMRNYAIGYHPLFMIAKCASRIVDKPLLVGSASMLAGYFWGMVSRCERPVPKIYMTFLRDSQIRKMKALVANGRMSGHESRQ